MNREGRATQCVYSTHELRTRGSRLGSVRYRAWLESSGAINVAKVFWIVTAAMVLVGIALVLGGFAVGMGPIAIVCGVLLLWSGIVKVIVLRIWRATLPPHDSSRDVDSNEREKTMAEYPL